MKKEELIRLIAENLSKNTMDAVFPYIAPSCEYYSSGEKRASGKEEVCAFFLQRKEAADTEKVPGFAFPGVVEESAEENIPIGTNIAALAQHDPYNCVGFMTIQTDENGMITRFDFNTTSAVRFKVNAPGKFNIVKVPEDAHEAVSYRAFAFGILDEHVKPSRHVQRYDEFEDYADSEFSFVMYHVVENFEHRLMNIAGYLYASAMASAVERERGITLFQFDTDESDNDYPPIVEGKYQLWLSEGFERGRELCLSFIEYYHLREPDDETLNEQLMQTFRDIMFYASIQANKDMDLGKI